MSEAVSTEQTNTEVSTNDVSTETIPVFDPKNPVKEEVVPEEELKPMVKDEKEIETAVIEGAPEAYQDFELPKDTRVNGEMLEKVKELSKKLNLPQERAQELASASDELTKSILADNQQHWEDLRTEWVEELKADKEFGGTKFKSTLEKANEVLRKYGSEEFIKFLDHGMGDNAEMVKMLAKIGSALSEDKVVDGDPAGSVDNRTQAQKIYGNSS